MSEFVTKERTVPGLIEHFESLSATSGAPKPGACAERKTTPHAGMTVDRNRIAEESLQQDSEKNMSDRTAALQCQLEVSQDAAPLLEERANTQASLQAISEKMQSLMASLQNVEASRKQDSSEILEILRAEIQGKISNLLDIDNKLGRTMDRNTTRVLESIRGEVERILSEKLTVLQSQLEASQHAAPLLEERANTQASLQAISEKMQCLIASLQNVEASRKQDKQDLEILRAEIQGKISNNLEAAKRSWSEENLLDIENKPEELQAQGRARRDAENESLKKENEELLAKYASAQRQIEELQAQGRAQGDAEKESLKKENELLHVQRHKVDVILDANTAHPRLQVSEDGKSVTDTGVIRRVPVKKERFDCQAFVLATEGYKSGRRYWEVDVGRRSNWILGVAQETVTRKGEVVLSPQNGFWAIALSDEQEYGVHTDPWTRLTVSGRPRKIGIFLDIPAKKLSFYNVRQKQALYTFTFDSDRRQEVRLFPFFSTGSTAIKAETEPLQIAQEFDDDEI